MNAARLPTGLGYVLRLVVEERARQDSKWGEQNHIDHPTDDLWAEAVARLELHARASLAERPTWAAILLEEVAEALQEDDPVKLRAELVQVAAVAAAWMQAIERRVSRQAPPTPPRRVYIATGLDNVARHNAVRDDLARYGFDLTYDWTAHGSVWQRGAAGIREVAVKETQGVLDADAVVVLLPGGRGTHTELGMAIAAGKPVVLVTEDPADMAGPNTCAFYHHPLVRQIPDDRLVVDVLRTFRFGASLPHHDVERAP